MWQIDERKEYVLTRGDLIDESVVTTNYEKSADVIVLEIFLGRTELKEVRVYEPN